MNKIIIFFLSILLMVTSLRGWERYYGGLNQDEGRCVRATEDNCFIILGNTSSFGDNAVIENRNLSPDSLYRENIYVMKVDDWGNILWTKAYGLENHIFRSNSLEQTTDGGYIITGTDYEHYQYYTGRFVYKVDSVGDTTWVNSTAATLGYMLTDRSVQQTEDGGYVLFDIIIWDFFSPSYFTVKINITKFSSDGTILWQKFPTDEVFDQYQPRFTSGQQTSDLGYIMIAKNCLYKTDSLGDSTWAKCYELNLDNLHFMSVQQTADDGYIITGNYLPANDSGNIVLVKTDSLGDTIWVKIFGGDSAESVYSVEQTVDLGFILTGYTESFGTGGKDVYLVKTDADGNTIWEKTYGGSDDDMGYSVRQLSDGGFIIAGNTYSFGAGESDIYLIRTDSNGVAVEENVITNPQHYYCYIKQVSNSRIQLNLSLPQSGNVKLDIYDISGRYLFTPINNFYSVGSYKENISFSGSGTYFYRLESSYGTETGKFMVVR